MAKSITNVKSFNEGFLAFLGASPTPFHATQNLVNIFESAGFECLDEKEKWNLKRGGKYFVTRNSSSIIGFQIGKLAISETGVRISGAHTDSPCLRVRPNPDVIAQGYQQVAVEIYGGALLNPWFDRDLSLAGRVTFRSKKHEIVSHLVDFKKPIALIPSLAIHLNREANEKKSINKQTELLPIIGLATDSKEPFRLNSLIEKQLALQGDKGITELLDWELSFYDTQKPCLIGVREEFLVGARLDNLLSCYAGAMALLNAKVGVSAAFVGNDHEEVGSASTSGAEGTFLKSILDRWAGDPESSFRAMDQSLFISTDNAHGIHPNYPNMHDAHHAPRLNNGPAIKINSNQRYASNSETVAHFISLCVSQKIPFQKFVARNDMGCGSTIGPITATRLGIKTVDVGVPTFGMHSIRETAGSDDAYYLYLALRAHFSP